MPPDGATTSPKSARFAATGPMKKTMHQIAVLRAEIGLSRRVVVRSHQRIHRRIRRKFIRDLLQCVWVDADIGIQEKKNVPLCIRCTQIARRRRPTVARAGG
jgi:hypothetical protein